MNELFNFDKNTLRRHNGRYATENQFLRDENKRLSFELELERRKQPAWRQYRTFTVMSELLNKQIKEQKEQISQLKQILKNLKNENN